MNLRKRNNLKLGFSLIEISIVIMIIGALMAAAIGGYRYLDTAKVRATESKLSTLDVALDDYKNRIGEYPSDLHELLSGPSNAQLKRKWAGAMIKETELEDTWGRPFVYSKNAKGAKVPYELYSVGKNEDQQIYSKASQE